MPAPRIIIFSDLNLVEKKANIICYFQWTRWTQAKHCRLKQTQPCRYTDVVFFVWRSPALWLLLYFSERKAWGSSDVLWVTILLYCEKLFYWKTWWEIILLKSGVSSGFDSMQSAFTWKWMLPVGADRDMSWLFCSQQLQSFPSSAAFSLAVESWGNLLTAVPSCQHNSVFPSWAALALPT